MLEVLNKRRRDIDQDNLKHVNHFFKKDIVKNQKKLFKWLAKFNKQEIIDIAPKFSKDKPIDGNEYISFVNSANTLLFSKYKQMTENLKVVGKLRNMITDFAIANGIYTFLLIIDDFYEQDKKADSFDKRKYWIKLNNDYVDEIWSRYKAEYLSFLNDDKILRDKADDAFNFNSQKDDEPFFPKQTIDILFGFFKKAWGHKRVTDRQFNTIYLYTLFSYYYMYILHGMMTRILLSFPEPKVKGKKVEEKFALKQKEKQIKKNKKK